MLTIYQFIMWYSPSHNFRETLRISNLDMIFFKFDIIAVAPRGKHINVVSRSALDSLYTCNEFACLCKSALGIGSQLGVSCLLMPCPCILRYGTYHPAFIFLFDWTVWFHIPTNDNNPWKCGISFLFWRVNLKGCFNLILISCIPIMTFASKVVGILLTNVISMLVYPIFVSKGGPRRRIFLRHVP